VLLVLISQNPRSLQNRSHDPRGSDVHLYWRAKCLIDLLEIAV